MKIIGLRKWLFLQTMKQEVKQSDSLIIYEKKLCLSTIYLILYVLRTKTTIMEQCWYLLLASKWVDKYYEIEPA